MSSILHTCLMQSKNYELSGDDCQIFHTGFLKQSAKSSVSLARIMRRAINDHLKYCDRCTSRLKHRTSVPPSTILYGYHTPDIRLNEMEVKFTSGDWCHPVSWRLINAFHGIDVGNSGLLGSCQQRLTSPESSNFIWITIKNYVPRHKIFVQDNFYYTVNMSFGTRTYFRLRYE